jgi:hypothetical protein
VDLLNKNEKGILSQLLKGLPMSQIADIYMCTVDEVDNVRLQIIAKFEQFLPVKSPVTSHFDFTAGY